MNQYLIRKNKQFEGFIPILFEKNDNIEKKFYIINDYYNWSTSATLNDYFNLDHSGNPRTKNDIISNFGLLSYIGFHGILAIVLKKDNKLSIYCNNHYFDLNPSRKKYINIFAKNNNLSVRTDIYYIDKDLINTWIQPIAVNMNFYDDDVQKQNSSELINKLKANRQII